MALAAEATFLRQRAIELGVANKPLGPLAVRAREAWPQDLRTHLQRIGQLDNALRIAEANTGARYAELVEEGQDPRAAMELAQADCLLPATQDRPTSQAVTEAQENQVQALVRHLRQSGRRALPGTPPRQL